MSDVLIPILAVAGSVALIAATAGAAAPALAAVTGGGTAAASGVAVASSSIIAGFTATELVSGGLSLVSAAGAIRQGQAERAALRAQADISDFNAEQQRQEGLRQEISLLEEGNTTLAALITGAGARGAGLAGSVGVRAQDIGADLSLSIGVLRDQTIAQTLAQREGADILRRTGRARARAGFTSGVGQLAGAALAFGRRG